MDNVAHFYETILLFVLRFSARFAAGVLGFGLILSF